MNRGGPFGPARQWDSHGHRGLHRGLQGGGYTSRLPFARIYHFRFNASPLMQFFQRDAILRMVCAARFRFLFPVQHGGAGTLLRRSVARNEKLRIRYSRSRRFIYARAIRANTDLRGRASARTRTEFNNNNNNFYYGIVKICVYAVVFYLYAAA